MARYSRPVTAATAASVVEGMMALKLDGCRTRRGRSVRSGHTGEATAVKVPQIKANYCRVIAQMGAAAQYRGN